MVILSPVAVCRCFFLFILCTVDPGANSLGQTESAAPLSISTYFEETIFEVSPSVSLLECKKIVGICTLFLVLPLVTKFLHSVCQDCLSFLS